MATTVSFAQASLAATIVASLVGTYYALSPPNPAPKSAPSTGDWLRWTNLTHKHATKVTMAPLAFLGLHTSSLVYNYPNIPPSILRHGAENGLNLSLVTWSTATFIPLSLIICVGIPLRLISYASLGKNFTFALKEPDQLKTSGIYRYVQHPSYTGLVAIMVGNMLLLGRMDGVLSCWISPPWYETWQFLRSAIISPLAWTAFLAGVWARVKQEEQMLGNKFGVVWEQWHSRTARFIPWVF